MKKGIIISLIGLILLSGCAPSLGEGIDAEKVDALARQAITHFDAGAYEAVADMARPDVREALTAQVLAEVGLQVRDSMGEFVEFRSSRIAGGAETTEEPVEKEIAIAMVQIKYENGTAIYTVSFDKNYELVGFYVR